MGLEDRDWYREEPSKEWRRQRRSSMPTPGRQVSVHPGAWLAICVSAVAFAATWHWNPLGLQLPAGSSATPSTPPPADVGAPLPSGAASRVIRLAHVPGIDTPVSTVTRWRLSDRRFGTLGVFVPIGKTPREALTVELAARGYQVVP